MPSSVRPNRRDDATAPTATNRHAAVGLTYAGIVAAAVEMADREGTGRLSMRRLAGELGVDPMSLYHYVKDKDALLGAMVDAVIAEIPGSAREGAPAGGIRAGDASDAAGGGPRPADRHTRVSEGPARTGASWPDRLRALVLDARATMLRHPWAPGVVLTRATPSPTALAHVERVLAILRGSGLSVALTHHALHLLGSRILGFSRDLFDDSPDDQVDEATLAAMAQTFPRAAELAAAISHSGELGGCDDNAEFTYGLDLLLDAIEARHVAEARGLQSQEDRLPEASFEEGRN